MQNYKTIKDMRLRDRWLKSNGYSPSSFFNPDIKIDLLRAMAASKRMLGEFASLLTQKQIELLGVFNNRPTQRRIYQVLNLYKRIRRQLHRHRK